jgi:PAS domain S-box-containing protein
MTEAPIEADGRLLRALLIEDSRLDAELLRLQLARTYPNARLEVVRDEEGWHRAIAQGGWDLILSDFELPGFTGADLLEHRNRLAPEVPFVFVSGVIGEDNAVELLKRGATDYVSKARLERLPLVLRRALREVEDRRARDLAERQLRHADMTFAKVVDALRDYAVMLLDDEGRLVSWNRAASEVFGWRADEVLGRSAGLIFPGADGEQVLRAEMAQARHRGKASDNRWLVAKDGRRLWAEGVLSVLQDEDGGIYGFCKVVHDATEGYLAAEALRVAKEEADRANRAKDRFLAVLSHELRTPLAPITTAVHVLEKSGQLDGRHRDLLPMIRRNIALEARLIDDLLDLTAISSGKVSLRREPVEMHQITQAVVAMVAESIEDKRIRLELQLGATHSWVEADQARMQQVLWNVLRNAVKFTPAGGRIVLRTSNASQHFLLECTDSGIGIDGDALPRIFRPFEQADEEVSRRYGGLGLGLAIAHGLVAQHGGQIAATSAGRGQGATFTLRLPAAARTQAVSVTRGAEAPAAPGRRRVLLVEDNEDAAVALSMCLEAYGYQVEHVGTCAGALAAARDGAFDAVLTDLGLPDGSGIDVGRELAKQFPVLALSGYGREQDRQRCLEAGFAGHLVKPADPAEVHARLSAVLAREAQAQL